MAKNALTFIGGERQIIALIFLFTSLSDRLRSLAADMGYPSNHQLFSFYFMFIGIEILFIDFSKVISNNWDIFCCFEHKMFIVIVII